MSRKLSNSLNLLVPAMEGTDDPFGEEGGFDAFEQTGDDAAEAEDAAFVEEEGEADDAAFGNGGDSDAPLDGLGEASADEASAATPAPAAPAPAAPAAPAAAVPSAAADEDDDDAPQRAFEAQWQAGLVDTDASNEAKKQGMLQAGKAELEQYYAQKKKALASKAKANREEEQELVTRISEALQADNPWERVNTLVDMSSTADDETVSRFRRILQKPKASPQPA